MIRSKKFSSVVCAVVSLIAWGVAGSCESKRSGHDERDYHVLWFVHATDPHIYLELKKEDTAKPPVPKKTDGSDPESIWDFQQKLDDETFKNFFQKVGALPQPGTPAAFIIITGDFGVDPCLILGSSAVLADPKKPTAKECVGGVDQTKRAERVDRLVERFAASPVRNIYFVAGNNDLPLETADDAGLGYFNQFFQDVQTKLSAKNVDIRLHNLTGCYGPNSGAISDCTSNIPGTSYCLIGFPSYSFKNKDTKYADNQAQQTAQFNKFHGLFDQAAKDGKKVLIVTHIPEMDDPYFLARERYDGVKPADPADPDKDNPRSPNSTWNVQKSLLDDWTKVLASDSVIAVLAGHLHDGHKEIYEQPYSWSTLKDHQMGYRKLFLAPPLSVKAQNSSPIQARGFSVVTLKSDHLSNRFYWYNGLTSSFSLDASHEPDYGARRHRWSFWRWFGALFAWLWDVEDGLDRIATFLIALLTAFLTVITLWQNPPSDDPLAKKPAGTDASAATPPADPSPFTTRFGKTILAGLGGFVAQEVVKTLGNQAPGPDLKWYYIVCFIFFFFVLLVSLNFIRALAEALRSRVAIIHYPLARRSHQAWPYYWFLRIVSWFFSLRVPLLTFFDTFINLIQGKNQTNTQAFANAIIEQQRNVIRVADTIRKKLNSLLQSKTREAASAANRAPGHVRVNISVLSADQSSLFYISRSAGSGLIPFPKVSLAWVSVFTGLIRWYESNYKGKNILLFDNTDNTIPDATKQLKLDDYYEDRHDDYAAFVVIPVPRPQRAFGSKYVKGAIHISFASNEDFVSLWPNPAVHVVPPPVAAAPVVPVPPVGPAPAAPVLPVAPVPLVQAPPVAPAPVPPAPAVPAPAVAAAAGAVLPPPILYPQPEYMLGAWCQDPQVQTALGDAVAVLGELLHAFNEVIYTNYIQPNQGD